MWHLKKILIIKRLLLIVTLLLWLTFQHLTYIFITPFFSMCSNLILSSKVVLQRHVNLNRRHTVKIPFPETWSLSHGGQNCRFRTIPTYGECPTCQKHFYSEDFTLTVKSLLSLQEYKLTLKHMYFQYVNWITVVLENLFTMNPYPQFCAMKTLWWVSEKVSKYKFIWQFLKSMVLEPCSYYSLNTWNRNRFHFKVHNPLKCCLSTFPMWMPYVVIIMNSETSTLLFT